MSKINKVKIISETTKRELESRVNNFIRYKDVKQVQFHFDERSGGGTLSEHCMVLYQEEDDI